MCIFSRSVSSVSQTQIFARDGDGASQYLAYQMTYVADQSVAMILPLPVPPGTAEDAVQFIDLSGYPELFNILKEAFPHRPHYNLTQGIKGISPQAAAAPLAVVEVGSFQASFVPGIADFSRLDPRFQFSPGVWSQLPQYATWGFAVFQLKAGSVQVHPMAFHFPRADPKRLFFPTVHVHDGQVHDSAEFDHILYGQMGGGDLRRVQNWRESAYLAQHYLTSSKTSRVVAGGQHLYQQELSGVLPNHDQYV